MVSVIMPVYNSEKYIAAAIQSVLCQTYSDFELICIDDGSTDSSGKICDEFAKKDSRIVVLHSENSGISITRNRGLEIARGDYVTFIDNDDEYMPELLNDNLRLIEKYDADFVRFGYHISRISADGKTNEDIYTCSNLEVLRKHQLPQKYKQLFNDRVLAASWDKIYRLSFLREHNLKFNENVKCGNEDIELNYRILAHANIVVLNPSVYYNYFGREGISTSVKYKKEIIDGFAIAARAEQALFKELNLNNIFPGFWYNQLVRYLLIVIRILSFKSCLLNIKEKASVLKQISEESPFCNEPFKEEWAAFKKNYKIMAWIYKLFYNKHFTMLALLTKLFPIYLKLRFGRDF